jgi:hypothetical protein
MDRCMTGIATPVSTIRKAVAMADYLSLIGG